MAETVQHPRSSRAAAVPETEEEVTRDLETLKAEIAALRAELQKVGQAAKNVGTTAVGAAKDQGAAAVDRVTRSTRFSARAACTSSHRASSMIGSCWPG